MTDAPRPAGQDDALIELAVDALLDDNLYDAGNELHTTLAAEVAIRAVRPVIEREAKRTAWREVLAVMDKAGATAAYRHILAQLSAPEADE